MVRALTHWNFLYLFGRDSLLHVATYAVCEESSFPVTTVTAARDEALKPSRNALRNLVCQ